MPMPKLSDLDYVLLISASRRPTGHLLPWPRAVAPHADSIPKAVSSLLRRKLIEEVEVDSSRRARRSKGGKHHGLIITDAGRAEASEEEEPPAVKPEPIVAAPPESAQAPTLPAGEVRPGTKLALLIKMLRREKGVTIAELMKATGWLPHTVRATISGLRKKGYEVTTDAADNGTRYRITGAA
jgi:hypothetical protein